MMKFFKKNIVIVILGIAFSVLAQAPVVSAAGCEIDYIEFSPFNDLTEGSFQAQNYWDKILVDDIKTTIIVHPKNSSQCAGKKFDLSIMSGYSDRPLHLPGAQFNNAGKFSLPVYPGENFCNPPEGAPNFCTYYAKVSHSWDGQLKTFSSAALGDYQSFPDTDAKQDKGIISYKKQNLGKIWTQNRTSTSSSEVNNCKILNAVFTPNGNQGNDFIANNYTTTLKITSSECIGKKIDVEIFDASTAPDTNAEVNVKGTINENVMTITYLPGDKECDEDEDPDCNFYAYFREPATIGMTSVGSPVVSNYSTEDKQYGEIDYNCHFSSSNPNQKECTKKWQYKSSTGIVSDNGGPIGVLPQGTYDTNSPCYDAGLNGGNGGYTDGCYELLAPIPGIDAQYTDGDGNVRDSGFIEEDGRQFVDTNKIQLGDYINQVFRIALGILMVIAVIMIIIAGVEYMTVESMFGKSAAKSRITNALTGLIIGLGIFLILSTINPKLLEVNFSPKEVKITFQEIGEDGKPTATITTDKKYSNDNACDESKNNTETCILIPSGISLKTGIGNKVEKDFSNNLSSLKNNLLNSSVGNNWQVTEAFKRTRVHKSKCHYIGTCIDMNFTGSIKANPTAKNVKDVINSAEKANMCAIYEVSSNQNRQSLINGGVPASKIKNYGQWISAPHFSIYHGSCK